jgi:hypothetical protein
MFAINGHDLLALLRGGASDAEILRGDRRNLAAARVGWAYVPSLLVSLLPGFAVRAGALFVAR